MRVVALIQARCGSSRLPGKALMPIAGRPLIAHVVERVQAVCGLDEIVLATSVNARDDVLASAAARCGVGLHRGSEWDVLGRMAQAAIETRADAVMRVTGDCPLFCPQTAEKALRLWLVDRSGYVWNDTRTSGYPDGTDVEVMGADWLQRAAVMSVDRQEREHVTPWIRHNAPVARFGADGDWSWHKWSVDTQGDLDFVRAVHGCLAGGRLDLGATLAAVATLGLGATPEAARARGHV